MLAEQFSVSVPFTQLEDEVECEAQQTNFIDRNMELCLKLTETPMEELLDETVQGSCTCEERPSGDPLQTQQKMKINPTKATQEHCTKQHVEQAQEGSEETPSLVETPVHPSTASAEKDKKGPAGVASGVSVAQLVMEEDSLLSESSDSQQDPCPVQGHSKGEDPLSSQSVICTPVRKYRRKSRYR